MDPDRRQDPAVSAPSDAAAATLRIVESLAGELHPRRKGRAFALDSSLERDIGLDSLARVELLVRLEKEFKIALPDQTAVTAETVRDLVLAVRKEKSGSSGVKEEATARPATLERLESTPVEATSLVEVLEWHVARHPDRPHITLPDESGVGETITYGELLKESERVAAGLRDRDVAPGQPVALMLPTSREYFSSFIGALLAGAVPLPLYPPHRMSKVEEHVRRQASILSNARAPILIASREVGPVRPLLKSLLPDLRAVVTAAELSRSGRALARPRVGAADTALLQYTSGSTGSPKGAVLSHANLLANIRAMAEVTGADSSDVFVSWLPLYHDMGLIGAWLGSLYLGARAVLLSPLAFLSRPERWLRTIDRERGTISAAPNFAYDLCATKVEEERLEGLNLASWRLAFNGAEAVHADTIDRFCGRFGKYGFRREAMTPVYGLAESSLGLAFPPPGRGPVVDRVRRDAYESSGRATPAAPTDPRALKYVSCGRPVPGHEIRIVDDSGRELGDRERGRIQFRGPSATAGYYRNPTATRSLFQGDWLDSGDYGYEAGGEIYVTGRAKDLIIKGGRNVHPDELEQVVGQLPGARRGSVAAFGSPDPRTGTERLVVVVETREDEPAAREALVARTRETAQELLDVPPDDVLLVPPRTLPKTPSGKIRRFACRELYERGELERPPKGPARQFARLIAAGALPTLRRLRRTASDVFYAVYAWTLFGSVGAFAWLAVVTLPVRRWRRALVRRSTRFLLWALRIRVSVDGAGFVPAETPCVVAANHFSYLDGIVLSAVLPPVFGYLAKRELGKNPLARLFFRRLGVQFVERFDPEKGPEEVAAVSRQVRRGESIVIFPEGTFSRAPGLLPFRTGAFLVAAQAGVPVVPVAIRGTRSILRGDDWFPRRGAVRVTVGSPLHPDGGDWAAAVRLRNQARLHILAGCGEPDVEQA